MVKNPGQETWIRSLGWEDPLEEGMATHSVFLPEECHGERSLSGYRSMGSMSCWFLLYYSHYDKTVLLFSLLPKTLSEVKCFHPTYYELASFQTTAITCLPVWATSQQGKIRRYGITWVILISDTVIRQFFPLIQVIFSLYYLASPGNGLNLDRCIYHL